MAPTRVIRCGTLFDATGAAPLRDAAVVVTDGRIAAVGPAATTPAPAGAEVVDWSDRFVMPGLIDCHSHASIVPGLGDQLGQLCRGPVPQALAATANLRRDLAAGTTTMRIMGEEHFLDLELREAVAAGIVPGPRLLVAGGPRREQRPRAGARRLRRRGRGPPRRAREPAARRRPRQDLRHGRRQLAGAHVHVQRLLARRDPRRRRGGRPRGHLHRRARARGPGPPPRRGGGRGHDRARLARRRRGHRADGRAAHLAHLHLRDLPAPDGHRAGRRPAPRHHGEDALGATARRRALPAPPRLRRALRVRDGQHARPHAVRAGHPRAPRRAARGTRCSRARAGARRPVASTTRWGPSRWASAPT